jgi:enoyl-CoA hydratase/carnithine racemase
MAYDGFTALRVDVRGKIAYVTIDNPPVNVITAELYGDLMRLSFELEADDSLLVVVFRSANPDFFIAHFDANALLAMPVEGEPSRDGQNISSEYHAMCERYRKLDKVTIVQIEGRIGGGGSEFAMSLDMRFGVLGKTIVNQMEVPLGILPGGTGTQRLPRLVGRGRALEIILGGVDMDAEEAERWGYLNRAFAPGRIGAYVEWLARRIASFPVEAVRLAKQAVDSAEMDLADGLREEAYLFQCLLGTKAAPRNMTEFLRLGGQTREGELKMAELSGLLGDLD